MLSEWIDLGWNTENDAGCIENGGCGDTDLQAQSDRAFMGHDGRDVRATGKLDRHFRIDCPGMQAEGVRNFV